MSYEVFKVFLISEALKGNQTRPIQIFTAKNYINAENYFRAYIYEFKEREKYNLHKIAEINNRLEITKTKVFVANGSMTKRLHETLRDIKENIEKASKKKTNEEQIKILFGGENV